ncbi:transposable element Tcb1 transposase [Trichonephila clavipes]|nr:transposable element Tcb1 transposase [Trichonephila clavipes]
MEPGDSGCGLAVVFLCCVLRRRRLLQFSLGLWKFSIYYTSPLAPLDAGVEMSARTIRRRLQQSDLSARRPLLGLSLTQNHRCLRCEWCDERRMWAAEWNEVVFTDESRNYLQHHDGRIRVWGHHGERMLNTTLVLHRVLWYGRYWISLSHYSSTHCRKHVAYGCSTIDPDYPPHPSATPDQLSQSVEANCSAASHKNTSKVSLNQSRGVWQRSPTMAATLATDSGRNHTSQKSINLII